MITDKVMDSGVLDKFTANMRADVQNPGLESYINTRISVGVRFVGTNGGVEVRTEGTGPGDEDHIPAAAFAYYKQLNDEGKHVEAAAFLMAWKNFGNTRGVETVIDESEVVNPTDVID